MRVPQPDRAHESGRCAVNHYLAASSADISRAKLWRDKLVANGVNVVSTWIETVEQVGNANPRNATTAQRHGWSLDDLVQIDKAYVFWFLVPPMTSPTRGAWLEFGYAINRFWFVSDKMTKPVCIASGDTKQSIFCALATEFETDEQAFEHVVAVARSAA